MNDRLMYGIACAVIYLMLAIMVCVPVAWLGQALGWWVIP